MNTTKSEHLKHLIKNLPNLPGVYQMMDKNGDILYVGKAKSLKNRVSSYFNNSTKHPRTLALVRRITHFEVIITHNETEALLLECNLIQKHTPPFNIMLRDDKSYLYIFLSNDNPPKLSFVRGKGRVKNKDGQFFGPFPEAKSARETLELMNNLFDICKCKKKSTDPNKPCCLHSQIRLHRAIKAGKTAQEDYLREIEDTLAFLRGKKSTIKEQLIAKMEQSAENLDFESAVYYRNKLQMISKVQANQAVHKSDGEADVMAIAVEAGVVVINVLTVRGGRVLGDKNFYPDMDCSLPLSELLEKFLLSFYFQVSDDVPKEIIINHNLDDKGAVEQVLREHFQQKTQIKDKVREHRAEWLSLAQINVENGLKYKLKDYFELKIRYQVLQEVLTQATDGAITNIDRIECFDISHTMGEATIASCVVYDTGGIRKRDYRQYAIHGVTDGDDYGAMRQALTRRYSKHPLPDLLLVDGGKGQLAMAQEVLDELGKTKDETLLISIAKGEGRKAGLEVLHFTDYPPLDLPMDSKALHLLMHVRDEAHRFAITAHRKKRDKRRSSSVLEAITGLGERRRRDLLNHFGGIQRLLSASEQELTQVHGIGKVMARTIYKTLHE